MIDKTIRLLVLLTAMMGLLQTGVFAAEPLPPRALARIGDHRLYHGPGITCAALSPDGCRIASAAHYPSESFISDKERDAYDSVIVLWDAATGERLCEAHAPQAPIWKVAFSPDSKRLAAYWSRMSADKKRGVGVFEVETGKLLWQRDDVRDFLSNLSYSSNSKQLWVSELRGPIRVWDLASGKQIRLWKPPPEVPPTKDKEGVCALCGVLSPDAKVVVWEMGLFSRTGATFNSVAICVHDAATNQRLYQKKLGPQLRNLRSFAFFSDSKRFAADWDDTLTVWETATGKELQALKGPEKVRFALAPDGRHAAIYEKASRFLLLDLATSKPAWVLDDGFGWRASFFRKLSQVFSADGQSLLLATDSTLRLFDTATGKERGMFGHRTAIKPSFSADGRTLFTICAERRCSWDVSRKEPTLLANGPRRERRGEYGHSADDRLFLDGSDHHLRVRERATGRVLRELEDCDHERRACYGWFSADATRLLVLYQSRNFRDKYPEVIWLYDVKTGKTSGQIKLRSPGTMCYPLFAANGRLVAWVDEAKNVHLHDAVSGKRLRTMRCPNHAQYFPTLLFSPNSEFLIVDWSPLAVRLFQVSVGQDISPSHANPDQTIKTGWLSCMVCSPDSRLVAVSEAHSGKVRLLEIASGKVRAKFAGHRHGVRGLAFAPDGKTLASGGEDNVVFLWDVTGARTPAVKPPPESGLILLWNDLASDDAKRAGVAISFFLRKPEASVAFLQERLQPAKGIDEKRLARLIADLDADAFETREAASRELTRLDERAESALRRTLRNRPSLETRRRIEDVLSKLEPCPPTPETLRALRAIEVLEHLGTPAARRCLQKMAQGATDARPTQDAQAALRRLTKKRN